MSFLIKGAAEALTANEIRTQSQINLGTTVHQDIDAMRIQIQKLVDNQPIPFVFLKSSRNALSSAVANDVLIHAGPPVPVGYRGVVQDFNINFGTAAGTIKLVIMDQSNNIISNVVIGITATVNGTGNTVIEEGQRLAVVGQVSGAGTFDTFFTGYIRKL